ncbi:hypothetical protein A3G98_00285 [Candidatus Nomurabacteria bacterium RIFCSPLOWO2_12_FULL_37_8]|uniref:Uncharacterized protein n=1 Tax=Candidatus Nomurabacteria bacterium RIFCSPLOWO2_12_FULL_37_8 TaxID=1801793 RepID=A0A1F6Y584_9BACT|nr:MAG: hypothetical protein A3G98_00285 [Candidatus Nomurabacteria bacterium RIFCSPLOWO2_12_FULL_37_8]
MSNENGSPYEFLFSKNLYEKISFAPTKYGSSRFVFRFFGSLECSQFPLAYEILTGGDDARNCEPKTWLKFDDLDKSIQKLRDIYKVHPEWFEVPKPKSDKGQNAVDYSI